MLKVIQVHFNDVDLLSTLPRMQLMWPGYLDFNLFQRVIKGKISHRKRGWWLISHDTMPSCGLFVPQYGE